MVVLLSTLPMIFIFTLNIGAIAYLAYYYDFLQKKNWNGFLSAIGSGFVYLLAMGAGFLLLGQISSQLQGNIEETVAMTIMFLVLFLVQSIPALTIKLIDRKKKIA